MGKRLKFVNLALFISTLMTCLVGSSAWILAEEVNMSNKFNTDSSVPIAYNDGNGKRYYQIERALEEASSGQNIYVIPSSIKGSPTTYTITKDVVTIKSGVNLILPYENTTVNNGKDDWPNGKIFFADENEAQVNEYRRTSITVDDNVRIIIEENAGLQIGGFTGNESPKGLTGHTSGSYTELVLNPGVIIDCYGTINCYGYIKEGKEVNNGSIINIYDGASLLEPFVIYDFKGGTNSLRYNSNGVCPFDIFDIPNVQSKLHVEYGGTIIGDVKAEMTMQIAQQINVVSKSDAPLLLTKGSIDLKYSNNNNSTEPYKYTNYYLDINDETVYTNTNAPVASNGSYTKNNANLNPRIVASLNENSTMDVNYINITLVFGQKIDSREFFFPLCYIYQISVENNAVLNVQYDAKFLWGSSLTIKEGGLLNVNADLVFYTANNSINNVIATNLRNAKYNRLMGYPNISSIGDATLINNGQINVSAGQSLSGNIISDKSDAILLSKYVQSKSRDVAAFDGSSMAEYSHDLYGNLLILNNGEYELTENAIFAESNKVYTSKSTSNGKYAWNELINDGVVHVAKQDSADEWEKNYKMCFSITDSITNSPSTYNYQSYDNLNDIGVINQSSVTYTINVLMGTITIDNQTIVSGQSLVLTGAQLTNNTIYIKPDIAKYTLNVSKVGGDKNPKAGIPG